MGLLNLLDRLKGQRRITMQSQALVPHFLETRGNSISENLASLIGGVALLTLLARLSIHLPFTPVPITGQTFGVALTSLLWGKNRGMLTVGSYLALGAAGLPLFAFAQSGLSFGPTSGYLIGMLLASGVMGHLADCGLTKSFWKTWLAASMGSLLTFCCGLWGLSFFLPASDLAWAGLLPFLPGDLIKTLFVSILVSQSHQKLERTN